ncbi:MAG: TIR domain-containing protein [Desulfobulbaceae bacterium]|nr:TIR domain-containing protein [Desulfobulbaceae bacterium]
MTKARIFISHSCKDVEISDSVPFEDEQDLRLRRLKYAKIVREEVDRLLGEHCDVLLDKKLLDPGDSWPIKLLRWLGDCDGAVLLLSEDAIESNWVLQEATVLTWRRRLRSDFKLIPVMLGGLEFDALDAKGFGPLQVNEIQAASVEGAAQLTRAEALTLAKKIADSFSQLSATEESNDMQVWLQNVAAILRKVDDDQILAHTCKPLGISEDDWAHFTDREMTVAHYLLRANLEQILTALEKIKIALVASSKEAFTMLTDILLPMWVDPAAAAALADRPEKGSWHAYAINSSNSNIAMDYAQRAWCCPPWWDSRFIEFNEHFGEGQEEEAIAALRQTLATHFDEDLEYPEVLEGLVKRYPFFIAMGDELADNQKFFKDILQALSTDDLLSFTTCIQLAGPEFSLAPEDEPMLIRMKPKIEKEQETQALINKKLIHKFIKQ